MQDVSAELIRRTKALERDCARQHLHRRGRHQRSSGVLGKKRVAASQRDCHDAELPAPDAARHGRHVRHQRRNGSRRRRAH